MNTTMAPSPPPSTESIDTEEDSRVEDDYIILRDYQIALHAKAVDNNIIVVLPTGTGKTQIAINLIRNKLWQTIGEFPAVARRTVFLAPTRELVDQQYKEIKKFVNAKIQRLHGGDNVDAFTKSGWDENWKKNQILVFTPQVLLDILIKKYIEIKNLNLIIVDEAHWALKKKNKESMHPYRRLMDIYKEQTKDMAAEQKPRILGLTASIFNPQIKFIDIKATIQQIEEIYQSKVESDNTRHFIKEAHVIVQLSDDSTFGTKLLENKNHISTFPSHESPFSQTIELFADSSKESPIASSMKKAIEKVQKLCYEQMGPWFAIEALKLFKGSMANLKATAIYDAMTQTLTFLQEHIVQHFRKPGLSDVEFALEHGPVSDKLKNLLRLLTVNRENLNCIVFVQERTDANLIYRWLLFLSENVPHFGFIKPGFICGSPTKDFIRFDKNTTNFKAKFENKELNVMVATAVLEEGIDVPICNMVIRYDFPATFRAFTQSKGRARDKGSFYILMVDSKNETLKWERLLDEYYKMEMYLKHISDEHKEDSVEASTSEADDDALAIYSSFKTAIGAVLNEKDALRSLHQYLQRLPKDFFTESRPNFILIERQDPLQTKYCYLFVLPINSSLTGIVKGEYRPSKANAKLNCAFKVCKLLYEKGEIDDHLEIISKDFLLSKHFSELNLKIVDRSEANYKEQLRNSFSKATYPRTTSVYSQTLRALPLEPSTLFHLYMIEFPNLHSELGLLDPSLRIGLLTADKLPGSKIDFLIYLNGTQLRVSVKFSQSYTFTEAKLKQVHFFHHHVREHVIIKPRRGKSDQAKSLLDALPEQAGNFFFVPIKHKQNQNLINCELIQHLQHWQSTMVDYHLNKKKVKLTEQTGAQLEATYPKGTIFSCFHRNKLVFYHVRDISNVLPTETFDWRRKRVDGEESSKKETVEASYLKYYDEVYGYKLEHTNMPMIHGALLESTVRSLWKFGITYKVARVDKSLLAEEDQVASSETADSGSETTSTESAAAVAAEKKPHQLFPAELALTYPLSMSYFLMLNAFPVIMYRLETFLIAHEFLIDLAALESPGITLNLDNPDLPYSLLTMDSYQNQASNKSARDLPKEEEQTLPPNDSDARDYKMMNIDDIELKENRVTNSTDQKILIGLEREIGIKPENKVELSENHLNELLEKLRQAIPRTNMITFEERLSWNEVQKSETLQYGDTSLFLFTGKIDEHIAINFNTFDFVKYPNPWYIVKAFTLKKANDIFNLEQLETVGDAFLKMTTAMYLYFNYKSYDEGKLSQLKTALVCNENLYKLALENGLQKYLISKPLSIGENWVVPFFEPAKGELIDGNKYTKDQELKYKNIADVVESLIGAFLLYGSAGSALCFFRSIGLKVFDPNKFTEDIDPVRYYQEEFEKNFENIDLEDEEDRMIIARYKVNLEKMVDDAYQFGFLEKVEECIGYKFKHKYFLVQAFTHPSFTKIDYADQFNYISSYQRLEFIGDAILDYVITYFIYHKNDRLLPADITLLRTSLVNNIFYSSIVVKYNLHKYLRCSNFSLVKNIANFVKKYKCQKFEQLDHLINSSFTEQEAVSIDDVDVPKALADIFEALVGAIYIDNGFDLDAVWRIVYRMIKVEVDCFSENIPVNPLAWLEKNFVNRYHFGPFEVYTEKVRRIILTITEKDGQQVTVSGFGTTKKMCKASAARRFMDLKRRAGKLQAAEEMDLQSPDNSIDDSDSDDSDSELELPNDLSA